MSWATGSGVTRIFRARSMALLRSWSSSLSGTACLKMRAVLSSGVKGVMPFSRSAGEGVGPMDNSDMVGSAAATTLVSITQMATFLDNVSLD